MGWLNADDKYLPGALSIVGEIFERHPEIEWLTTLYPLRWDVNPLLIGESAAGIAGIAQIPAPENATVVPREPVLGSAP